ncbi:MAG: PilZ domain-containing protein [Syntrophobacteria bacterium]
MPRKRFHTTLDEDLLKKLRKLAADHGRPVNVFLDEVIRLVLKKYQGEVFSPDLLELRGDGLEGGGRDYMRANVSLPATLIISSTAIEGEVTNISLRGALVHTQELLSPKENFNLHIEIPHSLFPLSPKVKMVRFEIYEHDGDVSYGLGVMFVDITEEDKRLISKLFT